MLETGLPQLPSFSGVCVGSYATCLQDLIWHVSLVVFTAFIAELHSQSGWLQGVMDTILHLTAETSQA